MKFPKFPVLSLFSQLKGPLVSPQSQSREKKPTENDGTELYVINNIINMVMYDPNRV
jgi:hypothetical protein